LAAAIVTSLFSKFGGEAVLRRLSFFFIATTPARGNRRLFSLDFFIFQENFDGVFHLPELTLSFSPPWVFFHVLRPVRPGMCTVNRSLFDPRGVGLFFFSAYSPEAPLPSPFFSPRGFFLNNNGIRVPLSPKRFIRTEKDTSPPFFFDHKKSRLSPFFPQLPG